MKNVRFVKKTDILANEHNKNNKKHKNQEFNKKPT